MPVLRGFIGWLGPAKWLALSLLICLPGWAQSQALSRQAAATLPRSLAALDSANGFRAYTFNTQLTNLSTRFAKQVVTRKGQVTVTVPGEPVVIGDLILTGLRCSFYNGRLSRLDFAPTSEAYAEELLRVLQAIYGPGEAQKSHKFVWTGQEVTLAYEPLISGPHGKSGEIHVQGQVSLLSNALLAEAQADRAAIQALKKR